MVDSIPQGRRLIAWRKYHISARRGVRFRTICEVLREVYQAAEERGDVITMTRMDEATDMAKRMQKRLEEYAGGVRPSLIHTRNGFAWVTKDELFQLTEDEMKLIEFYRVKVAKRLAKIKRAKAKAAARAAAAVAV